VALEIPYQKWRFQAGKIIELKWQIFQQAMFDYRRVPLCSSFVDLQILSGFICGLFSWRKDHTERLPLPN
jgi:hypothetical protein